MSPIHPLPVGKDKPIWRTWSFYLLILSVLSFVAIIFVMFYLQSIISEDKNQKISHEGTKEEWQGIPINSVKDYTSTDDSDEERELSNLQKGLVALMDENPNYSKDIEDLENRISELENGKGGVNDIKSQMAEKEKNTSDYQNDSDYKTLKTLLEKQESEIESAKLKRDFRLGENSNYKLIYNTKRKIDDIKKGINVNKSVYYGLLRYMKLTKMENLQSQIKDISKISFKKLTEFPEKYRGKFYSVRGIVGEIRPIKLRGDQPGIAVGVSGYDGNHTGADDTIYRVYLMQQDDKSYRYNVYICDIMEKPPYLKTNKEFPLVESDIATMNGVFYKVAQYETEKLGVKKVPVFIGQKLQKVDLSKEKRTYSGYGIMLIVISVMAVIFCAFLTIRQQISFRKGLRQEIGRLKRR